MNRPAATYARLLSAVVVITIAINHTALSQERRLTLSEKTNKAELILEGQVISMKSQWNEDQTRIYTDVTIRISERLKGEHSQGTVVVTHLGGEVGDVGEIYSETARFKENENVVVFLTKNEKGQYEVTGGSQGKYSVTRDEETNERMVTKEKPLLELKQEILRIVKL
jgi:hypothetical protein